MYVYQDFSKADKKLLQPLLNIAVQREIASFAKETLPMHQALVEQEHEDIRVPFWKLFEEFKDFTKHITKAYDGYSHRDIPMMVASSICNGDLTTDDIADFSEEGKEKLEEMIKKIKWLREE